MELAPTGASAGGLHRLVCLAGLDSGFRLAWSRAVSWIPSSGDRAKDFRQSCRGQEPTKINGSLGTSRSVVEIFSANSTAK